MKKIITGLIVIGMIVFASTRISAHSYYDNADLAHRLAVRFRLNENEVRTFLQDDDTDQDQDRDDVDQYSDHLSFIDSKLTRGVKDGWLTDAQKKAVLSKLESKMKSGPTADQYRRMTDSELTDRINAWKKEMRSWTRANGLTLDLIRNLTGKGNKYLMGIELD